MEDRDTILSQRGPWVTGGRAGLCAQCIGCKHVWTFKGSCPPMTGKYGSKIQEKGVVSSLVIFIFEFLLLYVLLNTYRCQCFEFGPL